MQKTLPLPYLHPSVAVLARIRQVARQVKPEPIVCNGAWGQNTLLA